MANQGTQHCVFAFRRFPHDPWEIVTVKESAAKAKPEFPSENRYRMRMQTVHVLPDPFGIVWQNEAHNTTRSNQLSEGTKHRVTNDLIVQWIDTYAISGQYPYSFAWTLCLFLL